MALAIALAACGHGTADQYCRAGDRGRTHSCPLHRSLAPATLAQDEYRSPPRKGKPRNEMGFRVATRWSQHGLWWSILDPGLMRQRLPRQSPARSNSQHPGAWRHGARCDPAPGERPWPTGLRRIEQPLVLASAGDSRRTVPPTKLARSRETNAASFALNDRLGRRLRVGAGAA